MTLPPDDVEQQTLELLVAGARRGLTPSAADSARVLHKVRTAIASGASPSSAEPAGAALGVRSVALLKKAAWVAAIAGASASVAYRMGVEHGQRDAAARVAAETLNTEALGGSQTVPLMPAVASATPDAWPPDSVAEPLARAAAEPDAVNGVDGVDAGTASRRKRVSTTPARVSEFDSRTEATVALVGDTPLAQPSASLGAEVRMLREVERALRDHEPVQALALLSQLEREVPKGQMRQERAAARAMARCQAGQIEPMQAVLEFSQRYPASVYFARVRQSCLSVLKRK